MQAFSFISLLELESSLLAPESSVFAAGNIPAPVPGNFAHSPRNPLQ